MIKYRRVVIDFYKIKYGRVVVDDYLIKYRRVVIDFYLIKYRRVVVDDYLLVIKNRRVVIDVYLIKYGRVVVDVFDGDIYSGRVIKAWGFIVLYLSSELRKFYFFKINSIIDIDNIWKNNI